MARLISIFWTTDGVGDGVLGGYGQSALTRWQRMTWLSDPATMAVATGDGNELEVTASGLDLQVNTGACMVYGFPAWLLTAAMHTLQPSTVSDTGWRLVVRIKWDKRTMETVLLQNTGGVVDIPDLVQRVGVSFDVSLAYGIVSSDGIVTINDDRHYMSQPGKNVSSARVAGETIEPINIANRTRTFWCDALGTPTEPAWVEGRGWEFLPGVSTGVVGAFTVPTDFVSDMTIRAVVVDYGGDGGTIKAINFARYGQGADYTTYLVEQETTTFPAPATGVKDEVIELELVATVGDDCLVEFERNGGHEDDDSNDTLYFLGWIISYIGDS